MGIRNVVTLAAAMFIAAGSANAEGHGKQMHKGQGKGHHAAMVHANPMPNLMRVIKKHGDQLDLTAEQQQALAQWREGHMKPMHAEVETIKKMENDLYQATLAGKPKAELMVMASRIANARIDVISTKADCRDNMRRVLSPEQFSKVLAIYQQ